MTVHKVDIYHCQKCGKVRSCEHEEKVPACCGENMAKAVANITYQDDSKNVAPPAEVIEKSHGQGSTSK